MSDWPEPRDEQQTLIAEDRAPENLEETVRQLHRINADQAARIDQLTSSGRRMTKEEVEALIHLAESLDHKFSSCPPGSGSTCKHRDAAGSARAKMKAQLQQAERRRLERQRPPGT